MKVRATYSTPIHGDENLVVRGDGRGNLRDTDVPLCVKLGCPHFLYCNDNGWFQLWFERRVI